MEQSGDCERLICGKWGAGTEIFGIPPSPNISRQITTTSQMIGLGLVNYPQVAKLFRLVNYDYDTTFPTLTECHARNLGLLDKKPVDVAPSWFLG